MRLLDITIDLGPGASLGTLEALVRGIRVAVDVAQDADLRLLRQAAAGQMRFPTDEELEAAVERLPREGAETSPSYRARRQLDARRQLEQEFLSGPPELWFELFYRRRRGRSPGKIGYSSALGEAGFERQLSATPGPFLPGAIGLDVLDPTLYQALVADTVARQMAGSVGVRQLHYGSPFFKRLFGKGAGEQAISTTVQVIESVSTLGSTRKMARADAEVAERTVDQRVEDGQLDAELKRLKILREQEALIGDRLANALAAEELFRDRGQAAMIQGALGNGQLHIADAIRDLKPEDAAALGELGLVPLELENHHEPDEPENS